MRAGVIAATLGVALMASACDTSLVDSDRKIAEGLDAIAGGQNSAGLRLLEEATQLAPDSARAHFTLGIVRLQSLHDPQGALEPLERASVADPTNAEAHYQRGVALLDLQRPDEAQIALEEAVEQDPQHGRALYRLALIAVAAEDVPLAIDYLTRSIWADPRFPMAYNELAAIYARFGRPREASLVLQNALANENLRDESNRLGHAQNRADLGQLHYELGEYAEAVRLLTQAAEMRPESGSIAFNLGIANRELFGESATPAHREAALEWLRRAQSQCNRSNELARCESIAAAMQELEQGDADR